jgi:hypothetical protein
VAPIRSTRPEAIAQKVWHLPTMFPVATREVLLCMRHLPLGGIQRNIAGELFHRIPLYFPKMQALDGKKLIIFLADISQRKRRPALRRGVIQRTIKRALRIQRRMRTLTGDSARIEQHEAVHPGQRTDAM